MHPDFLCISPPLSKRPSGRFFYCGQGERGRRSIAIEAKAPPLVFRLPKLCWAIERWINADGLLESLDSKTGTWRPRLGHVPPILSSSPGPVKLSGWFFCSLL